MSYAGKEPLPPIAGGTGSSSLLAHGILLGEGTSPISAIAPLANGKIVIGKTGSDPVGGSLTSLGGTITVTEGSGTLNIDVSSGSSLIGITDVASPFRTALGSGALTSASGVNNTAVGLNVLHLASSGTDNVAVGFKALDAATSASNSIGIGSNALGASTTGVNNQAIGVSALGANLTGQQNIAIGTSALTSASASDNCIAIGHQALSSYSTVDPCLAIGVNALLSTTTGIHNVAIGHDCLRSVTTGSNNTAIGYTSGDSVTTGANNTFLGSGSANNLTTGSNNIAIGNNAGTSLITTSNNISIGNTGNVADSGTIRIGTSGTHTSSNISGILTLANQPAFLATHTVAQTNVTGSGTAVTVNFTNEVYDQGSNYDGTNTFTAPSAGVYLFCCSVAFAQLDALATEGVIRFITTAGNFQSQAMNYGAIRQGGSSADIVILSHSITVKLAASNTVSVQVQVGGMGGDTVDIPADGSQTYFSGVKIA